MTQQETNHTGRGLVKCWAVLPCYMTLQPFVPQALALLEIG